jgi:putative flavoprotein involved in K+ transport
MGKTTQYDVIVIGGGQAGLSTGYHLKQQGLRFLILDANTRVGDAWRNRWDSLRLFSCARHSSLDGLPFPADPHYFPTKNEMADYLEAYAAHFELPVMNGVRVTRLERQGLGFHIEAGERSFESAQVVVAMANHQEPRVPEFAEQLDPAIRQLHSKHYKNPSQLHPGAVLLVGAGNSGSEIAMELSKSRQVYMSGRHTGHLPFRIERFLGRILLVWLVLRVMFHRVLTIANPLGRKARVQFQSKGAPWIRVKPSEVAKAGIERTPRVIGTRDGQPLFADGRCVKVPNVIWCTGFRPGFSWIDLDIFDERGWPRHQAGVVTDAPGLYFVGLNFLYAASSEMIHGVGRDAERVVRRAAERHARERIPSGVPRALTA